MDLELIHCSLSLDERDLRKKEVAKNVKKTGVRVRQNRAEKKRTPLTLYLN